MKDLTPTSTTSDTDSNGGFGFAPISGDITDGVLTLSLDSWRAWFSGVFFNQGDGYKCILHGIVPGCLYGGGSDAVTSYDAATGAYTADWTAIVDGGGFNSQIGIWHIGGVVSAVPVPAAVWLFGSGLIGLVALARRKASI